MTLELRQIPPTPRRVRWSAVLWRQTPLCLAGALLVVYGGVLTLLFWVSDHGSYYRLAEDALDTHGAAASGTVTDVRAGQTWRGDAMDAVGFRFETRDGRPETGESFCPPGIATIGAEIEIEYVPDSPHLSRVRGGHVVFASEWHRAAFWLTVAPGLGLLATWLYGVLRLRRLLRHGDAEIAVPFEVRRLPVIVPTMLEVRFRFRDRHAQVREGRDRVRARSELGERLATAASSSSTPTARGRPQAAVGPSAVGRQPDLAVGWRTLRTDDLPRLVVVHRRDRPARHSLVAATHFEAWDPPPRTLPPRARLG